MARRSSAPRRLAAFSLLIAACTGPAALPPPANDIEAQLAALEAETGHPWQVRLQPVLGTPALLEGRTAPLAVTPRDAERVARQFVQAHASLFGLHPEDDLATVSSTTDASGTSHARFQQRHAHLPVWGSELLAHFDRDGALVRINGRYGPIVPPQSIVPVIDADRARVEAASLARLLRSNLETTSVTTDDPELVLWPDEASMIAGGARPVRLAWHLTAKGSVLADVADEAPLQLETFVDATDGHILAQRDRILTFAGSGTGVFGDKQALSVEMKASAYWLEDRERGGDSPSRTFSTNGHVRLPGSELRSSDANAWDEAPLHGTPGSAVDAHAHVATAWDYFSREHGRAGWNDDGVGVRAVVHYGTRYAGAFYDGSQLVFGDGSRFMTAPSAALDLVAHEYTHGVIAATANLVPVGEPGAIGEGLADLFACLVAWESGQGAVWQIGEVVYHPRQRRNVPLRDLEHPHATNQPETRAEIDPHEADPHVNASIVGHLGYILVAGSPYGVRALGTDLVGRLFYRALTTYLFADAGFDELADALLASVRDIDPGLEPDLLQALVQMGLR